MSSCSRSIASKNGLYERFSHPETITLGGGGGGGKREREGEGGVGGREGEIGRERGGGGEEKERKGDRPTVRKCKREANQMLRLPAGTWEVTLPWTE